MKRTRPNQDPWKRCDPGVIEAVKYVAPAADVGRREFFKAVSGGGLVMALGGFVGWSFFGKSDSTNPGNASQNPYPDTIACVDVLANLNGYSSGKMVDQSLRCLMHSHFKICSNCRGELKKLKG